MTTTAASRAPHADRRRRLAATLQAAGGGIAIIPTAPERLRNGDTDHPYRPDSSFFHLTGFSEPQAVLVLDDSGRSVLFCRPNDPGREVWDGRRLGPEAAPGVLGVDEAHDIASIDERLPGLLADRPAVWWPFASSAAAAETGDAGLAARVHGWLAKLRARARPGAACPTSLRDLDPALAEMRLFKDAFEQETMRRAAAIAARAHVRAMRYCAARLGGSSADGNGGNAGSHGGSGGSGSREGSSGSASGGRRDRESGRGRSRDPAAPLVHEYELEAELLHEFRRHGTAGPAYPPIVAAGANACVLHHPAGDSLLRAGELCLIDAGCELDGYASDITRTFPAGGRFGAEQRALYDVVLAAQQAAIAETRPGARRLDGHWAAVRVLSQGLLDLGLLDRAQHGDADAVVERAAYRPFYMHGTGHWLGLDVHDVGDYFARDESPVEQPDGEGGRARRLPSRVLQPGMVLTVEPGLYVRPAAGVPERFWNIGIRIEDDALVTATGCELLSRGAPVEPDAIEALMREAREEQHGRPDLPLSGRAVR